MEKFDSYLGLPTLIDRSKYQTFSFLKERVWKKIQGWKGRLLFRAGKEVLIKAVAQSIPTYTMGVFQLPVKLYDEQDFAEVSVEMKRRFIGRVGIHWCNQRKMMEWDLGTFRVSIWQCWQNKGGGYCLIRSLFFVNVLRQNMV